MVVQKIRIQTKDKRQLEISGDLKTVLTIKREVQKPAHYIVFGIDGETDKINTDDIHKVEYVYYDIRP